MYMSITLLVSDLYWYLQMPNIFYDIISLHFNMASESRQRNKPVACKTIGMQSMLIAYYIMTSNEITVTVKGKFSIVSQIYGI